MATTHERLSTRLITGAELLGVKNHINTVFTTPDPFQYDLGGGGYYFEFLRNGVTQLFGKQYTLLLAGNIGVGIRTMRAPRVQDCLLSNYFRA